MYAFNNFLFILLVSERRKYRCNAYSIIISIRFYFTLLAFVYKSIQISWVVCMYVHHLYASIPYWQCNFQAGRYVIIQRQGSYTFPSLCLITCPSFLHAMARITSGILRNIQYKQLHLKHVHTLVRHHFFTSVVPNIDIRNIKKWLLLISP